VSQATTNDARSAGHRTSEILSRRRASRPSPRAGRRIRARTQKTEGACPEAAAPLVVAVSGKRSASRRASALTPTPTAFNHKEPAMLKIILIAAVLLIVAFVIVVSLRPNEFRISRSATISAPRALVHGIVNDLRRWNDFSPWAKLDPTTATQLEGPAAGVGAALAYASKSNDVGTGRLTIVESVPGELVRFRLEFEKPFKATNTAEFTFQAQGDQTVVAWTMSGTSNFICKAVGLFMDCDAMVGAKFEEGLANLKSLSEAPANL
jgi:hypothetical protein